MDAICGYRQPTSDPNRRGLATRRASKRSRDGAARLDSEQRAARGGAGDQRERAGEKAAERGRPLRGAEVVADRGGRQPLVEERRWVAEGWSPHVEETDEAQLRPLLAKEMEKPRLRSPLTEERQLLLTEERRRRRGCGCRSQRRGGSRSRRRRRSGNGSWRWRRLVMAECRRSRRWQQV